MIPKAGEMLTYTPSLHVMQVIDAELMVEFDVDFTLVMHYPEQYATESNRPPPIIKLDYYGMPKLVCVHEEHIELLKSYKARGFHITVHSNNGVGWVKEVVTKLMLNPYVDVVKGKAIKHVDDQTEACHIVGQRVYIPYRP
jgi:hypothetical protein